MNSYCHILSSCLACRFICFFLIFSLVLTSEAPLSFAKPNLKYASIVIDANSGMVLSQENADRTLFPASLTKIMTMVLVFDALNAKKITPKTRLVASSHSASMPPSKVGLKPGQTISVHDALRILATKSANDIAVVVAENLGGSEIRFARLMNLKARSIGLTNTQFVNASGLHDYRQYSSARDMAKLAKYVIDTYPQYYSIFGLSNYYYGGKSYHNHNRLMRQYKGMDGIKTGYVAASGFNLVSSAKRGNTRLIGVVFGGRTANSRNSHMADLLDRGFKRVKELQIAGNIKTPQIFAHPTDYAAVPVPPKKPGQAEPLPAAVPIEAVSAGVVEQIAEIQSMKAMVVTLSPEPAVVAAPSQQTSFSVTLPEPKPETQQVYHSTASHLSQSEAAADPIIDARVDAASNWQIQIGAYEDRTACNKALYQAMTKLPKQLNKGQTVVFPLRTQDAKWIFRARLAGYTHKEALTACRYFKDCLAIPPSITP